MKIISAVSWKGGTGKTSLTIACIETLAKQGKKILIIDLDSNLAISSVYNITRRNYNSCELLSGNIKSLPFATSTNNVFIIPSDLRISLLNNISDRVLKVNLSRMDLSEYDYIFLDPVGTICALTRNCMVAADKIIIPSMFSDIEFEATKLLMNEFEMCGVEADISIVLNRYDEKRTPQGIEEKFRQDEQFKDFLWQGRIPAMKSISRLTSELQNGYQLQGRAKEIIENFIKEVIE